MKKIFPFAIAFLLFATTSCESVLIPKADKSQTGVFEYLWDVIDRQYAFFDIKGVDWDSIYSVYSPQVSDDISNDSLFDVLSNMIAELHDGHTNLFGMYNTSQDPYLVERQYSQANIDSRLVILNYLTPKLNTTGGFHHASLRDGKIAYWYYSSFSGSASSMYLTYLVNRYSDAEGLIIDIRQNGGGNVDNVWNILRLFPNNGQLLYETQIKNGPEHDNFTELQQVFAPEPDTVTTWTKPVVVLADKGSYSASSFFSLCTKAYENITLMGDTTLGGLGLPNGGELPNGWTYRFSITRTLSPAGENFENGVPPDVYVKISPDSVAVGVDNVIEAACDYILSEN